MTGTGRGRVKGRGRGRGIVTSHPSQPHIPSSQPISSHVPSSQPLQSPHTFAQYPHSHSQSRPTPIISQPLQTTARSLPTSSSSRNSQPRPTPIISPPLQTTTRSVPTSSSSHNSQSRPMPIISPPLQTTTRSVPTSSSSPNSQTRPTQTISPPLQYAPTSAPSPHSQTGTSVDTSHDPSHGSDANPHTETSLIPENIKWGSRDKDGRIWIRPAPGNNFQPEFRVRGAITKIFKEKFEGAWTSWCNVDETCLDSWFDDFKAKYKWLDKDEDAIKKSFNSRGSLALKNALFKVRSGKDEGGWIGENNLQELRAKWQAEDWQKLSMINKQNRQAQDGHNVHSGGSISAREHAKKMKVELNREPTLYELYERLHRPKGKPNEWLNEKQAKIAEIFQTQMTERQPQSGEGSSNNSTQQSDNDIYLEVVGGINKKGRIFGLGSQAATIKASMKDAISTDGTSAEEVAILKDKIQALTTELQQKNLEQEGIKQKVDRYERMFERLMLNKNLKALLIEPEEEAGNCNEEMSEDEMDDSLFD